MTADPTSTPSPTTGPKLLAHTFRALRGRNYRLFYTGLGLSMTGTWMRRTALGWLVYDMTGSKAMLGAVMAASLLPMFLFSPLAGVAADRVDKRRLMIFAMLISATASGTLAALLAAGRLELWHLFVLSVVSGTGFAFELPPRQAFVIELVGRAELMNAIALNSALVNLSRIVGPALAGLAMAYLGMASCFALDAASYLLIIGCLLAIRRDGPPPVEPAKGSTFDQILSGIREATRNVRVRTVLILLFLVGTFGWSFEPLMPAIARDGLGLDEVRYGLLGSLFGVGAIFGALTVAARRSGANRRRPLFLGVWTMVGGLVMLSWTTSFTAMSATLIVAGFGAILFLSTGNALVQEAVDDGIRGRIMGLWALTFGLSLPLGAMIGGLVAEALDPFFTLRLLNLTLLVLSFWLFRKLPRRDTLGTVRAETRGASPQSERSSR